MTLVPPFHSRVLVRMACFCHTTKGLTTTWYENGLHIQVYDMQDKRYVSISNADTIYDQNCTVMLVIPG